MCFQSAVFCTLAICVTCVLCESSEYDSDESTLMSWNTDQDSDSESDEFGTFRFKEKQKRTNFSEYQLEQLHMMLNRTYYYPSKKEKDDLSKIIQLRPAVVRNWFQNRRSRDNMSRKKAIDQFYRDFNYDGLYKNSSIRDRDSEHTYRLTKGQIKAMTLLYKEETHPSIFEKRHLCEKIKVSPYRLEIWFQNKRIADKKKRKEELWRKKKSKRT